MVKVNLDKFQHIALSKYKLCSNLARPNNSLIHYDMKIFVLLKRLIHVIKESNYDSLRKQESKVLATLIIWRRVHLTEIVADRCTCKGVIRLAQSVTIITISSCCVSPSYNPINHNHLLQSPSKPRYCCVLKPSSIYLELYEDEARVQFCNCRVKHQQNLVGNCCQILEDEEIWGWETKNIFFDIGKICIKVYKTQAESK